MHKTIVVSSTAGTIARHLQTCGCKVLDVHDAMRPGCHATAIITNSHRPDTCRNPWAESPADISLGGHHIFAFDSPTIHATGLQPEQVAERLRQLPSGNML